MSFPKNDRKVQAGSGKDLPDNTTLTNLLFVPAIALALKSEFGGGPSAVKTVARMTGTSERAARNWFEAKNGPNGDNLMVLIQHSDTILSTVLALSHRHKLMIAYDVLRLREYLTEMIAAIDRTDLAFRQDTGTN